jgi:hypothetical protein
MLMLWRREPTTDETLAKRRSVSSVGSTCVLHVYFQDTLCCRVHLLTLAFGTGSGYLFATPGLVEPRPHPR